MPAQPVPMTPTSARRRLLKFGMAAALAATLAACGKSAPEKVSFHGSDITGSGLGSDLAMVDQTGKLRTLADYRGKVVIAFFGFTHCPDVCPTAMAHLAQTLSLLGDQAKQVQVIMISVDPERDTPEIMGHYVTAFDPSFVGLTGTPDQLKETARSFKAYYAKVKDDQGGYSMDHSASFYLFDPKGDIRVLARPDMPAKDLAEDIKALLPQ